MLSNQEIVLLALSIVTLVLSLAVILQERRIKRILKGKSALDLEDSFRSIEKEYLQMKGFQKNVTDYLTEVEKRLGRSIQSVSTLRFNPWKGTGDGGNQSFASAFLTEKGDGVILSSLSVRDRINVFAKPLEKGKSVLELTQEEQTVLSKGMDDMKK
jgi:hypothetical protein